VAMDKCCVTFKNNMVKHFVIIVVTDSSHRENTYLLLDDFLADTAIQPLIQTFPCLKEEVTE
jgi:hypothetical protein